MRRLCAPLSCAALSLSLVFGQAQAQVKAQAQVRTEARTSARIPSLAPALAAAPSLSPSLSSSRPPASVTAEAAAAPAQQGGPSVESRQQGGLTLDQALTTALARNPLLRAAESEVAASLGAVDQAGVWRNPDLGIEQEDLRSGTRSTTVTLSQTIELGGKRAARVALARTGSDVARAELAARQAEIRASTVQAFFEALIAGERVSVAGEALTIAANGTAAAARRVTAGSVSPTEETRARVAEASARIDLRQARADRETALRALSLVMGVADVDGDRLDGRPEALPPLPDVGALAERVTRSPGLLRARGEVRRAEAAWQVERSRRMPDLTVSLGAIRAQEVGRTQAVIGLSIPLPIFDTNDGAQLEALRRRDAAQALALAEEQRLQIEVLQTVDQLRARAGEAQALQQEVLPGARSAWEAASRGFELGKFGFLDVLDAQRTWLQARTQYLGALAQVYGAVADLERRLGPVDADASAPAPNRAIPMGSSPGSDRPNPGTQP